MTCDVFMSSAAVATSLLNCRECSGRLSYQGDQDCVFNWSNKYLITWELGYEYAEFVAQAKLTFSQHHQQLHNRHRHCANSELSLSRGTHRWEIPSASLCSQSGTRYLPGWAQ